MGINLAAKKVLMSSYLYYMRDSPVLSDAENDALVKEVYDNWDKVEDRYKKLLDPDNTDGKSILITTSHCKYTKLIEGGALAWLAAVKGERLNRIL